MLDIQNAKHAKDSLAMTLYDQLFRRIVGHLNTAMAQVFPVIASIGILDIAGFGEYYLN